MLCSPHIGNAKGPIRSNRPVLAMLTSLLGLAVWETTWHEFHLDGRRAGGIQKTGAKSATLVDPVRV